MRGLFSKPVAGSTRRWLQQSKWTPTRGLDIRLDTETPKRGNTIGTWIRNVLILGLAGWVLMDQISHAWDKGFRTGFQQGYQQGLQVKPQLWQSGQECSKIVGSRHLRAGCPTTT